jgi:ferrous iron transport protein B
MLPPMAIFFPLFTLLEDFGYLPRVAFNLDNGSFTASRRARQAGAEHDDGLWLQRGGRGGDAHHRQPARAADRDHHQQLSLCNGRWPTQILIATIFIGGLAPAYLAGLISALAWSPWHCHPGRLLSFAVSWSLSRTVLRGEVSTFSLELPPYRPPRSGRRSTPRSSTARSTCCGGRWSLRAGRRGHLAERQHHHWRNERGRIPGQPG